MGNSLSDPKDLLIPFVVTSLCFVGLSLMGLTYGPLCTVLSELFPTAVRYTGSSLAFGIAGILGASLTPYIATKLVSAYGLQLVGYYLSVAAVLTIIGLLAIRKTKNEDFSAALETHQSTGSGRSDECHSQDNYRSLIRGRLLPK